MTDTDPLTEIRRHIAYSIDMDPIGYEERIQTAPDRNAATFAIAQELINAYAHDLAEKIRSMIDANDTYVLADEAADLIDPEQP